MFIARIAAMVARPRLTAAQSTGQPRKICWLSAGIRSNKWELQTAFVNGLQDLGYAIGRWINEAQAAASEFGLTVLPVEARTSEALQGALATGGSGGEAILTLGDPFTSNRQAQLLRIAAQYRLPAMHQLRGFVDAGGLAS